jgi:hypothetical protein
LQYKVNGFLPVRANQILPKIAAEYEQVPSSSTAYNMVLNFNDVL